MKNTKTNKMRVTSGDNGPRVSPAEKSSAPTSQTGEAIPLARIHLSVRATGISTLVVGERRFNRNDPVLYATLSELVRQVEPLIILPDSGTPGLHAIVARNHELEAMLNGALAEHESTVADLKQRLAEAEAAVAAATATATATATSSESA